MKVAEDALSNGCRSKNLLQPDNTTTAAINSIELIFFIFNNLID
jgi:hypothetical protein